MECGSCWDGGCCCGDCWTICLCGCDDWWFGSVFGCGRCWCNNAWCWCEWPGCICCKCPYCCCCCCCDWEVPGWPYCEIGCGTQPFIIGWPESLVWLLAELPLLLLLLRFGKEAVFALFGLELLFEAWLGSSRDWKPWKPESLSSALWFRIDEIDETLGRALRSPSCAISMTTAASPAPLENKVKIQSYNILVDITISMIFCTSNFRCLLSGQSLHYQ